MVTEIIIQTPCALLAVGKAVACSPQIKLRVLKFTANYLGKDWHERLSLKSDQLNFIIDLMTILMAHSFALPSWNCAKVLQIVSLQFPLVWSNMMVSQPSI